MQFRTLGIAGVGALALFAIMVPLNQRYLHLNGSSSSDTNPVEAGMRTPAQDVLLGEHRPSAKGKTSSQQLCRSFHQVICRKRGETRDPSGYVRRDIEGEVETLHIFEETMTQHPDWTREQVYEELTQKIYTPEKVKRVRGAFSWVKQSLERFIEKQPAKVFSPLEKAILVARLNNVELSLPPPAHIYDDDPDLITKSGVYYEMFPDGKARLRVGGAYLTSVTSWFNIIYTVSHELAHAIDPCELREGGVTVPAYQRLAGCFLKTGLVASRETRAECGHDDQLSEVFADWMAAQVAGDTLRRFATEFDAQQLRHAVVNSVRDLCEQDDSLSELDLTFHPSPEIRIEKIFGNNPAIRATLGCTENFSGNSHLISHTLLSKELLNPAVPARQMTQSQAAQSNEYCQFE
ncbi:MAG: hypothetical protein H7222_11770 [Methylotenera sp.]|nr:hypothetical protein [Oligoflexia bacterium]